MKNIKADQRQYAALPIRFRSDGDLEVMLITSRETKRWVVPKGWPMKGRTPGQAAMTEAFEEAGLEGEIIKGQPIGSYRYIKAPPYGESAELHVDVYLMLVSRQLDDWPERGERQTQWFIPPDAAVLVAEPALAEIIRKVPALARRKKLRKACVGSVRPVGSAGGKRLRKASAGSSE